MKKNIGWILAVAALVFNIVYWWEMGVSDFVPWTRTYFTSYEQYIKYLEWHSFPGTNLFIDEVPDDTSSEKYYCRQVVKKNIAAHSNVLNENVYRETLESRKQEHRDYGNKIIYMNDKGDCWHVDSLNQLGVDESFLDKVMHQPEEQQEYYCLIVISINSFRGTCYAGLIANDTTHEMIEFIIEIPDEIL
ncbi:MAG: hypothetical protein E7292_01815 [Lachnospiraceae bacterium]|nr:hypothetical protein [Lachnospiraceae bacterium]